MIATLKTSIHQCPTLDRAAPSLGWGSACAMGVLHSGYCIVKNGVGARRPRSLAPLSTGRSPPRGLCLTAIHTGEASFPLAPFGLSAFPTLLAQSHGPAGRLMPTSSLRSSKPPLISLHRRTCIQRTPPRSPWPRVATPARGSPRSFGATSFYSRSNIYSEPPAGKLSRGVGPHCLLCRRARASLKIGSDFSAKGT